MFLKMSSMYRSAHSFRITGTEITTTQRLPLSPVLHSNPGEKQCGILMGICLQAEPAVSRHKRAV